MIHGCLTREHGLWVVPAPQQTQEYIIEVWETSEDKTPPGWNWRRVWFWFQYVCFDWRREHIVLINILSKETMNDTIIKIVLKFRIFFIWEHPWKSKSNLYVQWRSQIALSQIHHWIVDSPNCWSILSPKSGMIFRTILPGVPYCFGWVGGKYFSSLNPLKLL